MELYSSPPLEEGPNYSDLLSFFDDERQVLLDLHLPDEYVSKWDAAHCVPTPAMGCSGVAPPRSPPGLGIFVGGPQGDTRAPLHLYDLSKPRPVAAAPVSTSEPVPLSTTPAASSSGGKRLRGIQPRRTQAEVATARRSYEVLERYTRNMIILAKDFAGFAGRLAAVTFASVTRRGPISALVQFPVGHCDPTSGQPLLTTSSSAACQAIAWAALLSHDLSMNEPSSDGITGRLWERFHYVNAEGRMRPLINIYSRDVRYGFVELTDEMMQQRSMLPASPELVLHFLSRVEVPKTDGVVAFAPRTLHLIEEAMKNPINLADLSPDTRSKAVTSTAELERYFCVEFGIKPAPDDVSTRRYYDAVYDIPKEVFKANSEMTEPNKVESGSRQKKSGKRKARKRSLLYGFRPPHISPEVCEQLFALPICPGDRAPLCDLTLHPTAFGAIDNLSPNSTPARKNTKPRKRQRRESTTTATADAHLGDDQARDQSPAAAAAAAGTSVDRVDEAGAATCTVCSGDSIFWWCPAHPPKHRYCWLCLGRQLGLVLDALRKGTAEAWPVFCPGVTATPHQQLACHATVSLDVVKSFVCAAMDADAHNPEVLASAIAVSQHRAQVRGKDTIAISCPDAECPCSRRGNFYACSKGLPAPLFARCHILPLRMTTTKAASFTAVPETMRMTVAIEHTIYCPCATPDECKCEITGCQRFHCTSCKTMVGSSITPAIVSAHYRRNCIKHVHLLHLASTDTIPILKQSRGTDEVALLQLGHSMSELVERARSVSVHGAGCHECHHRYSYLDYLGWADALGLLAKCRRPSMAIDGPTLLRPELLSLASLIQCPVCRTPTCALCGTTNPSASHFGTLERTVTTQCKDFKNTRHEYVPFNPLKPHMCPGRPSQLGWYTDITTSDTDSLFLLTNARVHNVARKADRSFGRNHALLLRTIVSRMRGSSVAAFSMAYWGTPFPHRAPPPLLSTQQ